MARITRIKVTNHRCLVDFEFTPEPINLLVGESGSGKSALFEVLAGIQGFVHHGQKVDECFRRDARTVWVANGLQRYELDLAADGLSFSYSVEVEHLDAPVRSVVRSETLTCDGAPLYTAAAGEVRLYADAPGTAEEKVFPFNSRDSFLALLEPGRGRERAPRFREHIAGLSLLKLDPREPAMQRLASHGVIALAHDGGNFVSWYRHLNEEDPAARRSLDADLHDILGGFLDLHFRPVTPDDKELMIRFDAPGGPPYDVPFRDVSDGQRALIVLYALLHATARKGSILFLDEPDNFVPLPEIQPWVSRLRQAVDEAQGQLFVISHHPDVIDDLAPLAAFHFTRPDGGATQVRPLSMDRGQGLKASEWIAHGLTP